jgi:hypothetical protein
VSTGFDDELATIRTQGQSMKYQRPRTIESHTLIGDWLIDSGCTTHMTPQQEDFIGPMTPNTTIVETANGGFVEVTMKGRVNVLINDSFQHNKGIMTYPNDVFYVPLLSRPLFSVAE